MKQIATTDSIEHRIYHIRGRQVMLDRDLATLYGVQTGILNQAVKRHRERFPEDFMMRLTPAEFENWRCQIGISNRKVTMGLRQRPYAFTQLGVAMLSSLLNSERAIQINIAIMRVFDRIREIIAEPQPRPPSGGTRAPPGQARSGHCLPHRYRPWTARACPGAPQGHRLPAAR